MLGGRIPYSPVRMLRRLVLAGLVAALLPSAALAAVARTEATVEGLTVALDLERRARAAEVEELDAASAQIVRAQDTAASRRSRLLQLARDPQTEVDTLLDAEDSLTEAEALVRAAQDRRRAAASRLVERGRRIAFLLEEIARRRAGGRAASDPVTGRWEVRINPGDRKGSMRLNLDGTIVSGDYVLDGGFRGSVRGTFVSEKLTLQRIDSERGYDANFYGQLVAAQRRLAGTWESTTIAPLDGPAGGTWVATREPDQDDTGGERP